MIEMAIVTEAQCQSKIRPVAFDFRKKVLKQFALQDRWLFKAQIEVLAYATIAGVFKG